MNRLAPENSRIGLVFCLAALGVGGCSALIEGALSAAQKTFLNAADKNYGNTYHDDLDKLLKTMVEKQQAPAPAPAPEPAAAAAPVASETPATTPAASGPAAAPASASALASPAAPAVLELEVALLREHVVDGRVVLEPIVDGDTLRDEYGPSGVGDNFKITFRANAECYVYLVSIDSTALVQPVFPVYSLAAAQPGASNPVQAGRAYMIPDGAESIQLDSYRGIEHFYFLASRTRRADLEGQLQAFAAYKRPDDPSRKKGEGDEVAVATVTEHAVASRGIKQSRQGVVAGVQTSQGTTAPVNTQVFFGAKGEGDILVTRWFRHE